MPQQPRCDRQFPRLLDDALAGDRSSAEGVVSRLSPIVDQCVRYYLRRRRGGQLGYLTAEDAAQDIWTTLWKDGGHQLRKWSPEGGKSLNGYVEWICKRRLSQLSKRFEAQSRAPEELARGELPQHRNPEAADPEALVEQQQVLVGLGEFLDGELSRKGKSVMKSMYFGRGSIEETATDLGLDVRAVYRLRYRVQQLARDYLARELNRPALVATRS